MCEVGQEGKTGPLAGEVSGWAELNLKLQYNYRYQLIYAGDVFLKRSHKVKMT